MSGQEREVDWPLIEGTTGARPQLSQHHAGRLEQLVLRAQGLPDEATLYELGQQFILLVREILALERVALYFVGEGRNWLQGVCGTDMQGRTVDERGLRHLLDPSDERLMRDCSQGLRAFESLEGAPLVAHDMGRTRVIGRGWLVKSAIVFHGHGLGIVYNDTANSGRKPDGLTQEMLAAFIALCAERFDNAWRRQMGFSRRGYSAAVASAMEWVHAHPALSHQQLAEHLGMSVRRLSKLFEAEVGRSLLEVRNARRLERFLELVSSPQSSAGTQSLLDIALAAGFGSYAQFHRVFCASLGMSPTEFLRTAAK